MTFFSRLSLLAAMIICTAATLPETAEAKWIPIFKCRQKPAEEAEPAPDPCPAPAPEPTCCPAPEPTPEPACPAPAPEQVCAKPEPTTCCCGITENAAAETASADPSPVVDASPATEVSPVDDQIGLPELAEGEVLISISPIDTASEESIGTLTSDTTE